MSPLVVTNASTHDATARTQSREAQVSRGPRPMTSGKAAAATASHTNGERASGPMANRMTSPQSGAFAGATGKPKMPTAERPATTVPMAHGAVRTRATPTASSAVRTRRPAPAATPTSAEPAAQDSAATSTIGNTAGANAPARATSAPSTATWPARVLRQRGPSSVA